MRGRTVAIGSLAVLLVAGGAAAVTGQLGSPALSAASGASPSAASANVTTAEVVRRTMSTSADLDGTLGYEAGPSVGAGAQGTLTRLPDAGTIIGRGGVLYELDGKVRPRLLYGERPMWRPLGPKVADGADVLQLEQNLKALGYAPNGMRVNRHWDAKTTTAVKRWQRATGRTRDGTLDGADLAFLPGAVRVATLETALGARVGPGTPVLGTTTATRVVTLALAASRQELVAPGIAVSIDLPGGSTVTGRVRSIGRVATAGENGAAATVPVTVDVDEGARLPELDAAPVTVHVVTEHHDDVLAVPVNALVALLEGGYAVEVVAADGGHRYVGVTTSLFEDGMVEVAGNGLTAGDMVVVPR